jgi:hypothetical protein
MAQALPEWLLPIQAVTWLATGDAGLAARALPDATAGKLRGHPDAISVEGWKPLSRRIRDERRAVLQQYLEYTESRPPRMRKEPLSAGQRAQLAGEPSEWNSGFSLTNLAIRTGSWPEPHIRRLVDAARSGKVATVDGDGNPIGSSVWNQHSMREALRRPGVLIMVPDPYHQIDEDTAVEPLFRRDDVLRLDVATEASPTTPGSAQNTPRPTDEEVAEFIKGKQAEWSDAGKKHGRDRLLAEAARHFGVARKYVLAVWKRKRLGKNRSTPKRS